MSDRTPNNPSNTNDETLVRLAAGDFDLSLVLVVDPAVLNGDSDPVADWVRATEEGIGGMDAEEWLAWVNEYQLYAA